MKVKNKKIRRWDINSVSESQNLQLYLCVYKRSWELGCVTVMFTAWGF
jgi:hypothetical protein